MKESASRFASTLVVALGLSVAVSSLHWGLLISQQRYLQLGFRRIALQSAASSLDVALLAALLLAAGIFVTLAGIVPLLRRVVSPLPRPLAIVLIAAPLLMAAIRVARLTRKTAYFHFLKRALTLPLVIALLALLAGLTFLALRRVGRSPLAMRTVAGVLALAAALGICMHGALLAGSGAGAARPNVVFVSLDTVRADHVGCYGYARPTTPSIDALARESTLFETAVSTAPWTLPSHASMFTALYPHNHGAAGKLSVLTAPRVTLAEVLEEAGYATAAFTGGVFLSSRFGLEQGFGVFEALADQPTTSIVERALHWLGARPAGKPFFLFVHTYEPHTPYLDRRFADASEEGRIGEVFSRSDMEAIRAGRIVPSTAESDYITELYDGDIQSADAALSPLFGWLRESGEIERTIVIVTSDHGEQLFERDVTRSAGHGNSFYDELVRVPLIVRYPPEFGAGRRVRETVSLVDIATTLSRILRIDWPGELDGCDLRSAGAAPRTCAREGVLSEAARRGNQVRSLRTDRYKYIALAGTGAGAAELYDLAADPGERRDLAASLPEIAGHEAARMRRYPQVNGKGEKAEIDPELREQLHSLGYVE